MTAETRLPVPLPWAASGLIWDAAAVSQRADSQTVALQLASVVGNKMRKGKDMAVIWMGAIALALYSSSSKATTNKSPSKIETPVYKLEDWLPALLSEYYPDLPSNASAKLKRQEGGKNDRSGRPLLTIDDFRNGAEYVSVSADLIISDIAVKYGTRVIFESYPDILFRIVDTGDNFRTDKNKQIRISIPFAPAEPFDIAVNFANKNQLAGVRTRYKLDRSDVLKMRPIRRQS